MKPPEEVFPLQRSAEFDYAGRPHHPFYYTLKPLYIQTLYGKFPIITKGAYWSSFNQVIHITWSHRFLPGARSLCN